MSRFKITCNICNSENVTIDLKNGTEISFNPRTERSSLVLLFKCEDCSTQDFESKTLGGDKIEITR